jgi:hypothetical protein
MDGKELERLFAFVESKAKATLTKEGYPTDPMELQQRLGNDSGKGEPKPVLIINALYNDLRTLRSALQYGIWERAVTEMYNVGWRASQLGMDLYNRKSSSKGGKASVKSRAHKTAEHRRYAVEKSKKYIASGKGKNHADLLASLDVDRKIRKKKLPVIKFRNGKPMKVTANTVAYWRRKEETAK